MACFEIGNSVVIDGLTSDYFNGVTATVVEIGERVLVAYHSGSSLKHVKVKSSCLRRIDNRITYDHNMCNPVESSHLFKINLSTNQGRQEAKKMLPIISRFKDAGRSYAKARPWDYALSANVAVAVRLISPDGTLLRQMSSQVIGKSGTGFGVSLYQSYHHFASMRHDSSSLKPGMPLYVTLNSKRDLGGHIFA